MHSDFQSKKHKLVFLVLIASIFAFSEGAIADESKKKKCTDIYEQLTVEERIKCREKIISGITSSLPYITGGIGGRLHLVEEVIKN